VPVAEYRYELRRGDEVVATGHPSREQPYEAGERVTIGGHTGTIRTVEPTLVGASYACRRGHKGAPGGG